jgi:hypothetical protein
MELRQIFKNHIGYKNRITREELCRLTGLGDSQLRIAIGKLRVSGIKIVSHHSMHGYFQHEPQTATQEDWIHYDAMIADMAHKIETQQNILESQAISQLRLLEVNNGSNNSK